MTTDTIPRHALPAREAAACGLVACQLCLAACTTARTSGSSDSSTPSGAASSPSPGMDASPRDEALALVD